MSKADKQQNRKDTDPELTEHIPDVPATGAYLRKLREDKGLSIQDISQTTRISTTNIRAMENHDYSALPADTFTRGFLGIYARFLGADAAQITADFMLERDESLAQGKQTRLRQSRHAQSAKKLAEPSHVSSITMAGIILLIILALLIGLTLFTSWKPFDFLTDDSDTAPGVMMEMPLENGQETVSPLDDAQSADAVEDTGSRFNSAGQDD